MTTPSADSASLSASDDTLVLASASSAIESELLATWLDQQRARHPETKLEVLALPDQNPSPGALAQLVEQLELDEDRSIVPVRVFWMPAADATALNRVTALLPGRNPYQPSERQQRHILRSDRARAQVVAGESAKVSELRQQWRDITVGDNPREFAHFVTRRALLAMERAEYRILGPQYKSPRLVRPEIMASARFRAGLEKIPGANLEQAGKMLDELATGWSRVSVDLVSRPRQVVQPRVRSRHRLRRVPGRGASHRAGISPGCVAVLAPVLHRRRRDAGGDGRRIGCRRCTYSPV